MPNILKEDNLINRINYLHDVLYEINFLTQDSLLMNEQELFNIVHKIANLSFEATSAQVWKKQTEERNQND